MRFTPILAGAVLALGTQAAIAGDSIQEVTSNGPAQSFVTLSGIDATRMRAEDLAATRGTSVAVWEAVMTGIELGIITASTNSDGNGSGFIDVGAGHNGGAWDAFNGVVIFNPGKGP
jgi:hypothetical protein